MRPSEVVRRAADYLARHDVESPRATAELLLGSVLRTNRAGLYTRSAGLSVDQTRTFGRLLCRRCSGTPSQHLTGEQWFRRVLLKVRPRTFIPRPETEILVDTALEAIEGRQAPTVVDVGTGCGAIALALKDERPDARVWATDLSRDAVALARENADRLKLDVRFLEGDLLSPMSPELRGRLHLVMSNPPYVRPEEVVDLPSDVRADPESALVGDLRLTERLLDEAFVWLTAGGAVVIEIGSEQGEEVAAAASGAGFANVRVIPDLAGRDRVLAATRP